MKEEEFDFEATFHQLKKSSQGSLVMVLIGAACLIGSLVYSVTRLAPLEAQIAEKSQRVEQLAQTEQSFQEKITAAKAEYQALKENIEKLYAVKVTSENFVYELKATAKATGRMIGSNPAYDFSIYINAPESTLNQIQKVTYYFDHPTFSPKERISTDSEDHFKIGYHGWGCLRNIKATLALKNGETQVMNFDMCQSLGGGWWHKDKG